MTLVKLTLSILGFLAFATTVIILVPGIPPDVEFKAFDIKPPKPVVGWFASNTVLDEAEVYFENESLMEANAVLNDNAVFTGDYNGFVYKLTSKHVAENVTQLQYECTVNPPTSKHEQALSRSKRCGMPLGMRVDKNGFLWTMDLFGGLTKINIKTGAYENIIPKSRPIKNKIAQVPEDLDISTDGIIYWSDGSTVGNFYEEMLGQPSGRLLKYDMQTRQTEVLLDNLHFSNGVCLSDDEEFVLVVETGSSRIIRYYLRGEKKGQHDIFVDGLPGYPDNLRSNGRGGFYAPLIAPWNEQFSMKVHLLSPRPILRKLILRSRHILLTIISYINTFFSDNIYLDTLRQYIDTNEPILNIGGMPKTAMVVELSNTGKIIGILNGKSGTIYGLSHISVGQKYAYMTGPLFASKIWRIEVETLRRMH